MPQFKGNQSRAMFQVQYTFHTGPLAERDFLLAVVRQQDRQNYSSFCLNQFPHLPTHLPTGFRTMLKPKYVEYK